MTPTRRHYWCAAPSDIYGGEFPVILLPDCQAYMRPEVGGMVIGVQEKSSATFDARVLPGDINTFSPTQGEEHWDIIGAAMEAISVFFPAIPQAKFSDYVRSEEHTSELQSLMRISYAVFCLKKKNNYHN